MASRTFRKDTGRSWVVVFATFWLVFLENGVVKSFGVLLPHIREQFATDTWVIGLSIALIPGFGSVICILIGAANKALSPPWTTAVCGLICAVGLCAASFAPNVHVLMLGLMLTGFASGTTTVAVGILSQYFDKHYNMAMTVSISGLPVAFIVMPMLTQFLFDIYGWRDTVLVLCGIYMHSIACCLLLKPPPEHDYGFISPMEDANPEMITAKHNSGHKGWYTYVRDTLDLNLFSNFSFVALMFIYAGSGYTLTGWIIYIVPHAMDVGFSPYKASAIAIAGGIGNLVGNWLFLIQGKLVSTKTQLYISIFAMSASLALDVVASIFVSYVGMFMCAFVFNMYRGLMSIAWFIILKDVIDEQQMVNAVGWTFAAYGGMSILSGFVSGWLFDRTGKYVASFMVSGAVCALTFIPQCLADIRSRYILPAKI